MTGAQLNRMMENRVRELAGRKAAGNATDHHARVQKELPQLRKALGLEPLPPRTDLKAWVTGVVPARGYRIEKLRYESRPGLLVTANLYIPDGTGPFPIILRPHGHWPMKKREAPVQASAIGLALEGFVVLVIDSPGRQWDDNALNERRAMGVHMDPWLSMGSPVTGIYVWDLMRGLDYLLTRPEFDGSKVGVTGASGGGLTSMYAFAMDERISACAPVCYPSSLEDMPTNGCLCNHLPGILELGDRSDILAFRAPAPVCIVGATEDSEFPAEGTTRLYNKLRRIYSLFRAESQLSMTLVEGEHDYNRRMRETVLAFFVSHLKGGPLRSYLPERRPLTDGWNNPEPANTLDPQDDALTVLPEWQRETVTFRQLLDRALAEPYPEAYIATERLAPWAKYGKIERLDSSEVIQLSDEKLPLEEIDLRLPIYLGLSVPEILAQIFHLSLPGGPEKWEGITLHGGGDMFTSVIASMKTLRGKAAGPEPAKIEANGPVASMTARFLALLRPHLEVSVSHPFKSWEELLQTENELLVQPGARYLQWPAMPSRDMQAVQ